MLKGKKDFSSGDASSVISPLLPAQLSLSSDASSVNSPLLSPHLSMTSGSPSATASYPLTNGPQFFSPTSVYNDKKQKVVFSLAKTQLPSTSESACASGIASLCSPRTSGTNSAVSSVASPCLSPRQIIAKLDHHPFPCSLGPVRVFGLLAVTPAISEAKSEQKTTLVTDSKKEGSSLRPNPSVDPSALYARLLALSLQQQEQEQQMQRTQSASLADRPS